MTQLNQTASPAGDEHALFIQFGIAVEFQEQRVQATCCLSDILNAVRPANATLGHALGILLQYSSEPLEAEPIQLVIDLLRAAIGEHVATPPTPVATSTAFDDLKQAAFNLLPDDDKFYVSFVGRGRWIASPLNTSKTHSEYAVHWSVGFESAPVARHWIMRVQEGDLCARDLTYKGDQEWAQRHAETLASNLNEAAATPRDCDAFSPRLRRKPHLLDFIQWENYHAAYVAGGCTQSDLEVVSRPEEGGGSEANHSGDYLLDDPIGDTVLA